MAAVRVEGGGVEASEHVKGFKEMNMFDFRNVVVARYVAECAWEGVRRGNFLITTD
jgi:hypothetical protein